ncbi:hypothetical protein V5O48_002983 [Marasmius crinis-equi]|uniref:F-box domain-containing protein n=1 Tax=Marasmius crinis-equi TaxID=585013 RepID=A0ABR3FU74_9AGAR
MDFAIPEIPGRLVDSAQELKEMLRQRVPTDALVVENAVSEFEENVAQLQADIHKHKVALALLESKLDWMERSVEAGRSLLAPIRRVPVEILGRIFSLCCNGPSEFDLAEFAGKGKRPMPVVLAVVCLAWRDAAVSMSSLWSDLRYIFDSLHYSSSESAHQRRMEHGERLLRITDMFLRRAGNSRLSLSFEGSLRHITPPIGRILSLLCHRSDQWGSVNFAVPKLTEESSFQVAGGSLTRLHTIQMREFHNNDPSTLPVDLLSPFPALRHAKLWLSLERQNGALPAIPWHQLDSLFLATRDRAPTASQILPLCSNLTQLQLSIGSSFPLDENQFPRRIILPTVRKLAIHELDMRSASPFLLQLVLPNLTSFHLGDLGTFVEEDLLVRLIDPFLQQLPKTVTALSFGPSLSPHHASRVLRNLPQLTSVRLCKGQLEAGSEGRRIFRALIFSTSSGSFLPHLLHVNISSPSYIFHPELRNELVEAARLRCTPKAGMGVNRLRSVKLELLDNPEDFQERFAQLESLRDVGLEVWISTLLAQETSADEWW